MKAVFTLSFVFLST